MTILRRIALALLFLVALARQSVADVMELDYSGIVSQSDGSTGVVAGDRFAGSITYLQPGNGSNAIRMAGFGQYFIGSLTSNVSDGNSVYQLQSGKSFSIVNHGQLTISVSQGIADGSVAVPTSSVSFFRSGWATDVMSLILHNDQNALLPLGMNTPLPPTSLTLRDFTTGLFSFGINPHGLGSAFSGALDSVSLKTLSTVTTMDPISTLPSPTTIDPGSGTLSTSDSRTFDKFRELGPRTASDYSRAVHIGLPHRVDG